MLDLLIKSPVRTKIIGLFSLNKGFELYPRQVAIEIGESPHAVGLELDYILKVGLLKARQEGRHTYYKWNDDSPYAADIASISQKMRNEGNKMFLSFPDIAQRQRIKDNLNRVVKDMKYYYDPDKIMIFGSAATGKIGPYSDIDMIVVKKTSLPYFKRIEQLVDVLDYDVDIDFIIYTPEEFELVKKENLFFQREILKKGKVIYEKTA